MERKISLLIGVFVGIVFIFIYEKFRTFDSMFESFTPLIMSLLFLVGFVAIVVFGFVLIIDAIRNIR